MKKFIPSLDQVVKGVIITFAGIALLRFLPANIKTMITGNGGGQV